MKLPVQGKLCGHVGRTSHRTGCYLFIYLGIIKPCPARRLRQQLGKIVIGNLSDSIAALIDIVANLMGDAPAKSRPVTGGTGQCGGVPLNSDMVSGSIHKSPGKHSHIADVQMLRRQCVFASSRSRRIAQSLVLVKESHGFLHRL